MKILNNRPLLSWALYDWANSAFATTVIAGFFPVFFKQYWAADLAVTESTFLLGMVNAIASLVIVAFAPFLGALADCLSARKRFLLVFAMLGIVMTAGLSLLAEGSWLAALLLYAFAVIGFSGSNIFYDSLIFNVTPLDRAERASSLGFALGYLGGGVLFTLNILMVRFPEFWGFTDSVQAVKFSYLSVALWWTVFSLPLLIFVPETATRSGSGRVLLQSYRNLLETFKKIRQLRMTFLFLLAYWFYIDGVDTIIRMAVDFGLSVGLEANGLLAALLLTQLVGFPAALFFGWLGERKGPRFGITVSLVVYVGIVLWAYRLQSQTEFYLLALAVGLVQGGIQALSRSFYMRLVPQGQKAEFFGFYNMMGKFAAVIGPALVGVTALITADPRSGILSVLVLFAIGGLLLYRVDLQRGTEDARRFSLDNMSEK